MLPVRPPSFGKFGQKLRLPTATGDYTNCANALRAAATDLTIMFLQYLLITSASFLM